MYDLDNKAIGRRIQQQRELKKYTRESFAEELSLTPTYIRDLESGKKGMSIKTLANVSKVLNVSMDYIIFGGELSPDEQIGLMIASCDEKNRAMIGNVVMELVRNYGPRNKQE